MNTLTILQHNVAHWEPNKHMLSNTYREINPDIILINSHGLTDNKTLHLHTYTTYTTNTNNELHDGSAVLIKTNIKHKITNDFDTDILQVTTVDTSTGPVHIATTYLPPRRPFLPITDFHKLASNSEPTYILGDLNAKHPSLNNNTTNTVGRGIDMFINTNKLIHLGPNFPTYISHNSQTTPDIILTNQHTHHNYTITQGPTTASDHLPVIFQITTSPITTPIAPRPHYSKADWDAFKIKIDNNITEINRNHLTKEEIDRHINTWYKVVTYAISTHIPMKNNKTIFKPITNPTIKQIQWLLKQYINEARETGWSLEKYRLYNRLKTTLKEECKMQYTQNWEDAIQELENIYKDSKDFWNKFKRLKGKENTHSSFLVHNNTKIYNEKHKERIFRNNWENILTINPEENAQFDQDHETEINRYITDNLNTITPYNNSDLNRLSNEHYITSEITVEEVISTIKSFKNTTPGKSHINKTVLLNLPESTLKTLTFIFNHTFSAGYFPPPKPFKGALIKLIPKTNKPLLTLQTTDLYPC